MMKKLLDKGHKLYSFLVSSEWFKFFFVLDIGMKRAFPYVIVANVRFV